MISVNATGFLVKLYNNFIGHACIDINRGDIQLIRDLHRLRGMLAGG